MANKMVDYSFLNITDAASELRLKFDIAFPLPEGKAAPAGGEGAQKKERKAPGCCIRLANNAIEDLTPLYQGVSTVFIHPALIKWIDLSFNNIKLIGEALALFTELNVLYLHANGIENLKDLKPLQSFNLRSLTLHGNPVEEKKNYRLFVVNLIPSLNQLDFSPITRQDRETASAHSRALKGRRSQQDKSGPGR
uniref:Leucine-rich repeat-containing protein 51 n=1 Tax=Rhizochromulina marina TaxID=1034831 RepID=A0A7S2WXG2_9STRA